MSLAAGLLQFAVACYALRLNRLFGATRVGWSLFAAFSAMALLRLLLSLDLFRGSHRGRAGRKSFTRSFPSCC